MATSPEDKLRQLQELVESVKQKQAKLKQESEEAEKQLELAQKQIASEQLEKSREEEIQFLLERMQQTSAMLDRQLLAEFERKGLGRAQKDEQEQPKTGSLDQMLADAPSQEETPFQQLQTLFQQGDLYGATNSESRNALSQIQETINQGWALTRNQYQVLSEMQQEAQRGMNNPYYAEEDPRRVYAQQTNDLVESIKQSSGLQIGGKYLRDDDQNWGY